jgi:hypothetical protein
MVNHYAAIAGPNATVATVGFAATEMRAIAPTGIAEKRQWFGPTYSSSFRQAKAWFDLGGTSC